MAENNLLGKSHKQYVQDQIKARQEILGKGAKDSKELSWMNGKTSWVRLASSIDIENTFTSIGETIVNTGIPNNPTITVDAQRQDKIDGIKVGEYRVKNILDLDPAAYMGDVLANSLVLHGGTEKHNTTPDQMFKRRGISTSFTNSSQNISVYNSKNGDFGLVAMPGIQSVDIKSKSMGSLREASISVRINDPEQLELLETLYLRIGYSVFLEWGNSSYYKKDKSGQGNHEYVNTPSEVEPGLLFDFLTPPLELKKCPTNFVKRIEEERKNSEGNYDALFGRVKNFSWEFNPQGFYNATLEVISWGDIIESLSIDGFYPDVVLSKLSTEEGEENQSKDVEKKDESLLNGFIFEASRPSQVIQKNEFATTSPGYVPGQKTEKITYSATKHTLISDIKSTTDIQYGSTTEETISTSTDYSEALNYNRSLTESFKKAISGTAIFNETRYYYVRLGDILDFIKSELLIYLTDCSTPIIDINTNTKTNYCYNPLVNVSADPSKVMINSTIPANMATLQTLAKDLKREYAVSNPKTNDNLIERTIFGLEKFRDKNVKLEPFTQNKVLSEDKQIANVPVGLIMNIYFEKEFLYNTVDQLRDKKTGQLSLYKFIKALLDEANSCLGGVNKLDLRVVNDQTLEIYDQVPLYEWKKSEEPLVPQDFNIFGLKPKKETITIGGESTTREYNDGSFVTNFGLKTELTNEFATITSIGAQANGSVVGEDATFLSKWNFGLVDRFYPKKLDSYRKRNQQQGEDLDQKEFEALLEKITNLWSDYSIQTTKSVVVSINGGVNNVVFNSYRFPYFRTKSYSQYVKIQKDFLKALIKLKTKEQNVLSNQMGMLPINLNLEMDGISGIRIYDQIRVNTRFLPSYYPTYLTFIIKGLSHSFNGNRWITKIDTIAQPKVQFDKAVDLTITDENTSSFQEIIDKTIESNSINDKITVWEGGLDTYFPVTFPVEYREPDSFGSGDFGAGRGDRLHYGVDLEVTPGQEIYSPIPGLMRKITSIYTDGSHPELKGVEIAGTGEYLGWYAQILYVDMDYYNGFNTKAGYVIGKAQNMADSYGRGMTNHVHYAIYKRENGVKKYVDVESLLKNYYSLEVPR